MPSTQGLNYTETITYPKKVDFTVAHRHQSGFSKDGGKTRIDVPQVKRILNQDRCVLSKKVVDYFNALWGSEYLTINDKNEVHAPNNVFIGSIGSTAHKRYIKGQNTIWKAEQDKLGIRPSSDDEILMIWGDISVDFKNKPTDKGLLIFLLTHNLNEDYEFKDSSIATPSFKIRDARRDATKDLDIQDKIQEAREIVFQVKNRHTNRFDEDKMNFYTNVFKNQISGYDSNEEKFKALLTLADTKPEIIINGVNKETVNYLQVVQQAFTLDILSQEKGKVVNTMTKNTVVTFKVGTSQEAFTEKLVDYYASKDGANEFEHLKNSVEAVKMSIVS